MKVCDRASVQHYMSSSAGFIYFRRHDKDFLYPPRPGIPASRKSFKIP